MRTLLWILIAYLLTPFARAPGQTTPVVRKQQYNLAKGLAIQGYDPVAYFTQSKAIKGAAVYSFTYREAKYRFASPAHLELFRKNPEKYEPQYGGWCAYAMGDSGKKVGIDPETYKIKDGKLFLFYHTFLANTLSKWNANEATLYKKADFNWSKIK